MARTLVENLADSWDPSQYTDQYRDNLMKIIKAKLKGKEPHLVEHVEPRDADVVDLMERLRQSLAGAGGGTGRKKKTARAQKPAARGRRRAHAA
jgi:DNA end-binding protein Ku